MRAKATIALPADTPPFVSEAIRLGLESEYPRVDFEYTSNSLIQAPKTASIDRNGADLGAIDGDKELPFIALISGINIKANRIFSETRKGQME